MPVLVNLFQVHKSKIAAKSDKFLLNYSKLDPLFTRTQCINYNRLQLMLYCHLTLTATLHICGFILVCVYPLFTPRFPIFDKSV